MAKTLLPPCPRCGTAKQVVQQGELFYCKKCGGLHDGAPEEGGTYSDHNPAARLEREERRKKKR